MRCYFMKNGHIAAVEELPGLSDEEAVEKSREMFETRKDEGPIRASKSGSGRARSFNTR
jgi:hypothetical protein